MFDLTAVIAFLFGASGGIIWKLYDKYIVHRRLNIDEETSYRAELKKDIDNLRAYVQRLEEDNRETKRKYMELYKDYVKLQISNDQIIIELEATKEQIAKLSVEKKDKS